jgi:hypothetical protein
MHASKRSDHSRATSQKHCRHQNVCEEAKADVHAVGYATISSSNDFEEGVRIRCSSLQLNGNCREQNDLNSGT